MYRYIENCQPFLDLTEKFNDPSYKLTIYIHKNYTGKRCWNLKPNEIDKESGCKSEKLFQKLYSEKLVSFFLNRRILIKPSRRIEARTTQWITATKTPSSQDGAFDDAVFLISFHGIFTAGGYISTTLW